MMGILKMVPPAYVRCPGSVFGCIPPMYWTVGVGTVWKCDHCGRVWERVSRPGVAWAEVPDREIRDDDEPDESLDDCAACDAPLSVCGGRNPACCDDCTHGANWATAAVGPDCRDGKHDGCDGRALDEHADEIVECGCPHHRDSPT